MISSGPEVPPEVPSDFADVYRAAYEAAMRESGPTTPPPERRPKPVKPEREERLRPVRRPRPAPKERAAPAESEATPTSSLPVVEPAEPTVQVPLDEQTASAERAPYPEPALAILRPRQEGSSRLEHDREDSGLLVRLQDSGWLVPLLLVVLALVLVLGAYVVGRAFSQRVGGAGAGEPRVRVSEIGKDVQQPTTRHEAGRGAGDGTVASIPAVAASVDCTVSPGLGAAGTTVTYTARQVVSARPGRASSDRPCGPVIRGSRATG